MPSTITQTPLHDPSSTAYKKAKRQYLKTTRGRDDQAETEWTPFRTAEKKYKAKFPPPDLSRVLDLAVEDETRSEEVRQAGWHGSPAAVECKEINLMLNAETQRDSRQRKAYVLPSIPGLVLLPSFVSSEEQRHLVRWSLRDHSRHPNETNLDTHYLLPEEGLWNAYLQSRKMDGTDQLIQPRATVCPPNENMEQAVGPRQLISNEPASKSNYATLSTLPKPPSAPSPALSPAPVSTLVPKLRWANIGWFYHWGTKQYDFTRGKIAISDSVKNVCQRAVKAVPWDAVHSDRDKGDWGEDGPDWASWHETYEPDAGIVNFYQTKDTLMAHVDRSEVCATSPLVSISLGCAAIFLIGGLTRDTEPTPILLRSGDVVIMSGPRCRRAYHGVPRILENTLPPHFVEHGEDSEWEPYEEYLRTTRINVNVRQVFPKGFNPVLQSSSD